MHREKFKISAQVLALFVLPVVLIISGVAPAQYRFFLLLTITALVIVLVVAEKWTLKELGIRLDNIKNSTPWYLLLTVLATGAIIILAELLDHNVQDILSNTHFWYGFIILSLLQEFLFRSFLIPKLKRLSTWPALVIVANGLLFGFIHIIFPNSLSLFLLSSLLGSGFAAVYFYRPNLILATISHSIINFAAVFYCFATFNMSCT